MHPVRVAGVTGLLDGQPVHIVLGTIEGPEGPRFRRDLRETLVKLPGATVQDAPWPVSQTPPQRACVLSGAFRVEAKEELSTRGEGVDEKRFLSTMVATDFEFWIQDLATGLPLIDEALHEEDRDEVEQPKEDPRKNLGQKMLEGTLHFIMRTTLDILLDRKPVADRQRVEILEGHRQALSLRKETWTFLLCSEAGLPELKQGIEAARANDWQRAEDHFRRVVESQPHHSAAHKARYNLGIACMALERFDQALIQLLRTKALLQAEGHGLTLKERSAYMERNEAALEHCLRLDRMHRWRNGEPLDATIGE